MPQPLIPTAPTPLELQLRGRTVHRLELAGVSLSPKPNVVQCADTDGEDEPV